MKNVWILYGCIVLLAIAIGTLVFYNVLVGTIRDTVERRQKYEQAIQDKTIENIFSNQKIDSLNYVNAKLSVYLGLTQAMVHRDEATSKLKHKVGDVVVLKADSAQVVIEDVLIGGGKYNYYVKFKVLYKDNTTKEVIPELIY